MYLEWKAKPELWTSLAKMSSAFSSATNLAMASSVPEIVTLSAELWQAATISGGARLFVSSQDRPGKIHLEIRYLVYNG